MCAYALRGKKGAFFSPPPSNPWSEFASLPPTRIKERRIPINYAREDFSPKTRRGIVSLALVPSGVTGKRPIFNTSRGREGGGGHEPPLFEFCPRGQVERDKIAKSSEESLEKRFYENITHVGLLGAFVTF